MFLALKHLNDREKEIVRLRFGLNGEKPKTQKEIERILDTIGAPKTEKEIGIDCDLRTTFKATKDIRNKYVLSRLTWDLGVIDEIF